VFSTVWLSWDGSPLTLLYKNGSSPTGPTSREARKRNIIRTCLAYCGMFLLGL